MPFTEYYRDRTFKPCVEGEHDECVGSRAASTYNSRNELRRIIRACTCGCHPVPANVIACGHCAGWFAGDDAYREHLGY